MSAITEPQTWAVTYEALGFVDNQRMHYHAKARLVKEWRDAFALLARAAKVPHLDRVAVTVEVHLKGKRSQDVGGCYPAAKAGIDGLVDAGVLDDDDPEHLVSLTFLAPIFGAAANELTLVVTEVIE